ncbi:MAG: type II toxin-antitoxin system death-on-curing family toxin [Dehalococcoidia bacterium]|nr:type II toxin-antitoxin system death-on-curing family toxin [Dehalococcoidia bacterium]
MSTRYLSLPEVIEIQRQAVLHAGFSPVLIDRGKLESAVARPATEAFGEELFPTLAEKAAALLQALVIAHAFLDGNKRVAAASAALFLELNGVIAEPDDDAYYDLVIAVTTGELREVDDIAPKLAAHFALE